MSSLAFRYLIWLESSRYDTHSMVLQINGETRTVPPVSNVLELVEYLGIGQDRVAVEINRCIIKRQDWGRTALQERDQIEIVQFVGGG